MTAVRGVTDSGASADDAAEQTRRVFVWPPGIEHPARDGAGAASARQWSRKELLHQPGRTARWFGSIEDALIGRVCRPTSQALHEGGWTSQQAWECCPRCASTASAFEADIDGCSQCRTRRVRWDRAVRLGTYEGVLREQVLLLKYGRWTPGGRSLGKLLGEVLKERLEASGIDPKQALLVPVPMTRRRRLARGVDHTRVLATSAASVLGARVVMALGRHHAPAQASVPLSKRRGNVSGSMYPRGKHLQNAAIVLVDDVRTTGATLTEAWKTLERSRLIAPRPRGSVGDGVSRWVATVAIVEGDGVGS